MTIARARCHSHFLSRAADRDFCIGTEELLELEQFVGELRPCFELKPKDGQPQKTRYRLSLKIAGARTAVNIVYDTRLNALVTIYP
tara:strand:+ start:11592 stop:11849 length:258 start_codon:yes stop_codon:yes gene_type:complete